MKCPWGEHEFEPISDVAERNVEHYGGPVSIKAKCCGNIVSMKRKSGIDIWASHQRVDDWGYAAAPKKGERK